MAALAVFGAGLAMWVIAEAALTSRDRPAPGTLALPTALLVLVGQVGGVAEHLTRGGGAPWPVGAAVFAGGLAVRLWAIAALGPLFASALDSPRLITHGPYRWMRHPSELGLITILFGTSLLLASWIAAAAAIAALPLAWIRCRREDAALARRHPAAYAAWSRRARGRSPYAAPCSGSARSPSP